MITKDELAAMIAALESQPHLSMKEEKYLAVCKELEVYMSDAPCQHIWQTVEYGRERSVQQCTLCGELKYGRGNY
ncbi:hypothetical protein AH01_13 [Pantoea phage AH01]|nr:hypothetical protein AH01_13 [Pantoea phage AH01]